MVVNMSYVEVTATKISDWYFDRKNLPWHKAYESAGTMQNIDFKISANNLSNLTILLLTEPSTETPAGFINEFIIGKNQAPSFVRTRYGRDENIIIWDVPISRYTEQDGYIYCGYSEITPYSQYWTVFVEFPQAQPINVQVSVTETP